MIWQNTWTPNRTADIKIQILFSQESSTRQLTICLNLGEQIKFLVNGILVNFNMVSLETWNATEKSDSIKWSISSFFKNIIMKISTSSIMTSNPNWIASDLVKKKKRCKITGAWYISPEKVIYNFQGFLFAFRDWCVQAKAHLAPLWHLVMVPNPRGNRIHGLWIRHTL